MHPVRRFAIACLVLAAFPVAAQQPAPIERVKISDGEASCRKLFDELGEMDKAAADAKRVQAEASNTTTAGQAGGVAAEVASRTGLFAQAGGLFGHVVGTVATKTAAGAAQQSGRESAAQAAERERQAMARKEHLSTLFLARGCKASDPDAAPTTPGTPPANPGTPPTTPGTPPANPGTPQ